MKSRFALSLITLSVVFASCGPQDGPPNRGVPPDYDSSCPPDDAGVTEAAVLEASVPDASVSGDAGDAATQEAAAPSEAAAPPPTKKYSPCFGHSTKKDAAPDGAEAGAPGTCDANRSCIDANVCTEFNSASSPLEIANICGGSPAPQPCPTEGFIGVCVIHDGSACRNRYYYGQVLSLEQAELSCQADGGAFIPSQ